MEALDGGDHILRGDAHGGDAADGDEPHHSSSRAVGSLSAAEWSAGAVSVWAFGGRGKVGAPLHSLPAPFQNCHPEARAFCGPKDLCNFSPPRSPGVRGVWLASLAGRANAPVPTRAFIAG